MSDSCDDEAARFRIRATLIGFNEAVLEESYCGTELAMDQHLSEVWNEHFCWREGFLLRAYELHGSPRRWHLRTTIG